MKTIPSLGLGSPAEKSWERSARRILLGFFSALLALGPMSSAVEPAIDGVVYADGDIASYTLYSTSSNGSRLYMNLAGSKLSVAMVVNSNVNENVFDNTLAYTKSTGWTRSRPARNLFDSEYAEFTLMVGGVSWTWQQAYCYQPGGANNPALATWKSDHLGKTGAGTPPPGYRAGSSLAWNLNRFASGQRPAWDVTLGGTRLGTSNWKSPFDPAAPLVVPGLPGYPKPPVPITYDNVHGWEWPMIYEWQVDLTGYSGAVTVRSARSHHSPSKNGLTDVLPPGDPFHDYGDLAAPYPTLKSANGARHTIVLRGAYLGALLDSEPDGVPTPDAGGDDRLNTDDEDGVMMLLPPVAGRTASVRVTAGTAGFLSVFMDATGAGLLAPATCVSAAGPAPLTPGVLVDVPLTVPGAYVLGIPIPPGAASHVVLRFRFTNLAGQGGAIPTGLATSGEVEDHRFQVCHPPVLSCPPDLTVDCAEDVPPGRTGTAVAISDCGCPVAVTWLDEVHPGCGASAVIRRVWSATDACGNPPVTCVQVITVTDLLPPVQVGYLLDKILECEQQLPTPVKPQVTDNCDTDLTVGMVVLTDTSPLNCARTVRYVWTFTDDCGNKLRLTQTFFIRDRTRPVITCAALPPLAGDADCRAVLPPIPHTISDNCGNGPVRVVQSPPAGTVLNGPGTTTVVITATDACGNARTCGVPVTVVCGRPDVELVKTVYPGHDGGAFCPGAEIVISTNSAPVTYCFEVKNSGALNLVNLVLRDATLGLPPIQVGSLGVGQSRMFSAPGRIAGDLVNLAQVAGTSVTGVPVADEDDAEVRRIRPQIQILKTVAYGDNAPCPGEDFIYAVNGQPVTYCFVVTNLGDVPLARVVITDGDIGMSPIPLGDLAVGRSKPAQVSVIACGSLTNTAWAVGLPPVGPPVTDDDPAAILALGPGIRWNKTAYIGHDGGVRCPGRENILISGHDTPVTYCLQITNVGDVPVYNVHISDPALGFREDLQGLEVGESVMRHVEVMVDGPVTNVAQVTVLPPSGGAISLLHSATVGRVAPSVEIEKTVAEGFRGYAACVMDSADTLALPAPGAVTYCFRVRNTGNTHLNNLAITDPVLGLHEYDMEYVGGDFPLPPGEEAMYMARAYAGASLVNHVQITATPVDAHGVPYGAAGEGVGDTDSAKVLVAPRP